MTLTMFWDNKMAMIDGKGSRPVSRRKYPDGRIMPKGSGLYKMGTRSA